MQQIRSAASFADSKPHYNILDGLRGVAALLVVWYHVHEGLSFAQGGTVITGINHGYLAVDFFFILSGFVIGYAYDDRWGKTLTLGNFFKRRLIRLHPMVVMGTIVGAITFCIQGCVRWDGTQVSVSAVMLALLCGMFFIPAVPGMGRDVRGNGEMFPLNGPAWSLFFEYIGNIIYAVLTGILGALYAWFVITDVSGYGNMGVGWTLDSVNFLGGTLRMMFPYATGMLLARNFKPVKVRGAFWICSLVLLLLFIVPYIPSQGGACLNGVFEFFCVAAIFPLLVVLGASGNTTDIRSTKICNFLGDISYPLYITQYPIVFTLLGGWISNTPDATSAQVLFTSIMSCLFCFAAAYASLKLYDEPVRRWLTAHWLHRKPANGK